MTYNLNTLKSNDLLNLVHERLGEVDDLTVDTCVALATEYSARGRIIKMFIRRGCCSVLIYTDGIVSELVTHYDSDSLSTAIIGALLKLEGVDVE